MILKYKYLADGVHSITEEGNAAELGLPEEFKGTVQLNCEVDKSPNQILLNCHVHSMANMTCDRCTAEFEREISNDFQVACFIDDEEKDEGDHLNLKFLTSDQDKIDLSEEVKEYLILAIPMKNLCNEDCKGLCSSCGSNLNEEECSCSSESYNPVWEKLQQLKNNSNN